MSRAKRILVLAIENNKEKNCIRSLNLFTPLPLNVIAIDDNDSRMLSAVYNVIIKLIGVPNMRLTNNVEHSYKSPTSVNLSTEPSSHAERVITLLNEQNSMFGSSHISAISLHYASDGTAEDTGGTSVHDGSSEVITQHGPLPLMPISFNTPQNAGTDLISDESDVNMGLVPYSDHSDSDMSLDYPKKSKIRKKRFKVDTETCVTEKNKKLRERGLRYLGPSKGEEKWVYDIKKCPRLMNSKCMCKETKKGTPKCSTISEVERKKK
ncbi:hypothetical protein JTB14_000038 [Gonioctena quinquepunctata]|nr:hypothetical protein JTB14_000038 [Gonioctena quinquepunctata]